MGVPEAIGCFGLGVDIEVDGPSRMGEVGLGGRDDGPRVFRFEEEREEESRVVLV